MRFRLSLAAFAAALALSAAAHAQSNPPVSAQSLASCAGAIAASANINILSYAGGDAALDAILERMNREPGVEGMTGRYAASAARTHWSEQPAAERDAAVSRCRAQFATN